MAIVSKYRKGAYMATILPLLMLLMCIGMLYLFIGSLNGDGFAYTSIWLSIALMFLSVMYDPVYCETDKYIMKHSASIIGFDSAILYEKKGLLEMEKQRYKGVYPQSMIPLDSIGAIVIYCDFNNGETLVKDVSILPLDGSFDKDKAKDYAQMHNIRI